MTERVVALADPASLSLSQLLEPETLADPYPLYHRLRTESPVHWDPYLHAWVVTRYADVIRVLRECSADRTPRPEVLEALDLEHLAPVARMLTRQMLFMDAPAHTRLRTLAAAAFTPRRVSQLRDHIADVVSRLLAPAVACGQMDVIRDIAEPLPAIVAAELLGLPTDDWQLLKHWSSEFAEVLGNFQHNPDHAARTLHCIEEMTVYFEAELARARQHEDGGLLGAMARAEVDGDRLRDDEIIANCILTMVGGQETTTNLIGNGVLALLRNPDQWSKLRGRPDLLASAVEEMLRYDCPSQHTARLAPADMEIGGRHIRARQAIIAVMGAANRDPERFPDPDTLDIERADNRHVAFGWAAHFCFGAPLARMEGQLVFHALAERCRELRGGDPPLVWRENLGLRGLTALPVQFTPSIAHTAR